MIMKDYSCKHKAIYTQADTGTITHIYCNLKQKQIEKSGYDCVNCLLRIPNYKEILNEIFGKGLDEWKK